MRGATWVSLHNGGGTGWGKAINGGFGLLLDGTAYAEERAKCMLFYDVTRAETFQTIRDVLYNNREELQLSAERVANGRRVFLVGDLSRCKEGPTADENEECGR